MIDYYIWGTLTTIALVVNHAAARQVRFAGSTAKVFGVLFFLALANAFILFCWQETMRMFDVDEPAWVMLFVASIAGAVATGLVHTEKEVGSVSIFWSAAAGITRPWRDFAATRKEFARKLENK